jgi:hypothetical protein
LPDAEGLWPGCGILLPVLPTLRTVKRSLQKTPIKRKTRAVYVDRGLLPKVCPDARLANLGGSEGFLSVTIYRLLLIVQYTCAVYCDAGELCLTEVPHFRWNLSRCHLRNATSSHRLALGNGLIQIPFVLPLLNTIPPLLHSHLRTDRASHYDILGLHV